MFVVSFNSALFEEDLIEYFDFKESFKGKS